MRTTPLSLLSVFFAVGCTMATPSSVRTYTDADLGYAIDIPNDWTIVKDDYIVTDHYGFTGTSFVYPAGRDHSTLLEAKVHIAELDGCWFVDYNETINATVFSKQAWDGLAMGNSYQGQTFQAKHNGACIVVTLYTHSCNLGGISCGKDHVLPFSYDDTLSKLKSVFESLRLEK